MTLYDITGPHWTNFRRSTCVPFTSKPTGKTISIERFHMIVLGTSGRDLAENFLIGIGAHIGAEESTFEKMFGCSHRIFSEHQSKYFVTMLVHHPLAHRRKITTVGVFFSGMKSDWRGG